MPRTPHKRETGFSLIEVMVGMVIGLLAMLIIMQLYAIWEAQKRTTSSGGDAQSNTLIGLYTIERDLQNAGQGLSSKDLLGCQLDTSNNQRSPADITFPAIAPVAINPAGIPAGDPNTDIVQIMFGSSSGLATAVEFTQIDSVTYRVTAPALRNGLVPGDLIIAAQSGKNCTLTQVTSLPAGKCDTGTTNADLVKHENVAFKNAHNNCTTTTSGSHWNNPAASVAYSSGAKLYNVGPVPATRLYAIRNGRLTVCDYLFADCGNAANKGNTSVWIPIADNIVSLKAQYGRDTDTPMDLTANTWDTTTPTTDCGWAKIPAVRVALVGRSTQYEKAAVYTAVTQTWQGGSFNLTKNPDGSANAEWDRYRYKVLETVIPLRNIVWMGVLTGC
jgi:type IV pilus assembly protein PilW